MLAGLRQKIVKHLPLQTERTKGAAESLGDKINKREIFLGKHVMHSLKRLTIYTWREGGGTILNYVK